MAPFLMLNLKEGKARGCEAYTSMRVPEQRSHRSNLVGLSRLELPTSPLSGVRSNQLSYRPVTLFTVLYRAGRDLTAYVRWCALTS